MKKKRWLPFLAALGAAVFFWRKKKREEEGSALVSPSPGGGTEGSGTPPGESSA
jgi:hypothetical protein